MSGQAAQHRYRLIFIVGVAACLLLVLSWPRLGASLRYLAVDTAISNYRESREIDAAQLDGLITRAQESIRLHDHYRYHDGLSELQILLSQDINRSFQKRREALEQSLLSAQETVRRAPSKPRTWLRIARLKSFLSYPEEQVISALKMSILTGRVEPTLMLTRLELGFRYLPVLDDETVRLLRDQAVLTWTMHQRAMLKRIESGILNQALLHELLAANHPLVYSEIEAHFVE